MNVSELLNKTDFARVWEVLEKEYYTGVEYKEKLPRIRKAYQLFFEKLKGLFPVPQAGKYLFCQRYYDALDENFSDATADEHMIFSVALFDVLEEDGDGVYSLSFIDWNKVMGFSVPVASVNRFGEETIAAHLLFELSFYGFDEQDMIDVRTELEETCQSYEQMSEEERARSTRSFDEVCEELGIDMSDEQYKYDMDLADKYMKIDMELTDELRMEIKREYEAQASSPQKRHL